MARDIKTTPIIRGKDAVNFYKKLEENKNKKIDTVTMLRIEQNSQMIRSTFRTK